MEDGGDSTPFWFQSGTNTRPADRLRRRVSSVFFSSGLVVFLLLLITAVFFLAFVVPSTLSLSAQILRPKSVKRSWDSLNIVLVLVAVVFGFISKIKNDDRRSYYDEFQTSPNKQNEVKKSPKASSSDQWYNNYNNLERQKANTISNSGQWYGSSYHRKDSILRRNSSSYPDLREFSSNRWDYQHRFYDDFHIDVAGHRSVEEFEAPQSKTILVVDTLSYPKEETESWSSPILPAKKRAYERTEGRKESRITSRKFEEKHQSVGERKLKEDAHPPSIERANGNATKDFFSSIYLKKIKKKSQKNPQTFQIPPPPPPAFQNLVFSSKKHKRKRRSTITIPLTPPNPNPTQNPPKIINTKSFDENSNSGRESPLNRMPPPPPPPPLGFFKTPAWKFVVQGDYVRVDSSRSGSPDLDDVDSDVVTPTASPLFHPPSPDVDTKADSFINSFRAKLKMEKNHSITKRQVGLSTLAPN